MAILNSPQKRTQEEFLRDLRNSTPTVNKVAEWLRNEYGYQVTLLPNEESPSHEERMSYTDNGDLLIGCPVEVKQNFQYEWTDKNDFPFDEVTVMAKHAWDSKRPKPHSVIMVDKTGNYAVVTPRTTSEHWVVRDQVDCRDGQHQDVYRCPKSKCIFITLLSEND
jgi:hypothetical protein